MTILLCLVKMVLATGLLYGYYWLFLRNRQFHRYNRFYLLTAALVASVTPFISIPLHPRTQGVFSLVKTLQVIGGGPLEEQGAVAVVAPEGGHWFGLSGVAGILYTAGVLCCAFGFIRSLIHIARIRRKYRYEMIDRVRFYNTAEPGTPFSFFRLIFWNRDIPFGSRQGQQIFRHEWFHVRQRHSSDLLFMELLCSIGWFNPFFHLIKRELKAIHEFLADEYALSEHDRLGYAELLVAHAIRQKNTGILHPFSQHEIKRRILMITQSNSLRHGGYFSRVMVLPLLLTLFSAFAFRVVLLPDHPLSLRSSRPLTVVIDAGHGGTDAGAWVGDLKEKDITLSLAQKVSELSAQYGVQVVMTRNSDILPGNAKDIKEGLVKRVEIANDRKADLMISLHVNSSGGAKEPEGGFIAFISRRRPDKQTEVLATTLLQQLNPLYKTSSSIRQRELGIWVLDKASCPAVIMECGNMDLPGDRSFITDKTNQEKIARSILQGILRYQQERH
ncbi:MAG TPA: M56/M15 family metallopeptidase [Puia sp.]|nr:M56/M15 family metallopeptidase [Puia sp.]